MNECGSALEQQGAGAQWSGWTIAGLIKLVDDAIDSAGAQLAQSEGLQFDWTDDEAIVRPAGGRRSVRERAEERPLSEADAVPEREIDLV